MLGFSCFIFARNGDPDHLTATLAGSSSGASSGTRLGFEVCVCVLSLIVLNERTVICQTIKQNDDVN